MAEDRFMVGGDETTFRVRSGETDGALAAAEVRMPAGGGPPVLHRHAPAEIYRVEAGELAIYVEDGGGEVVRHRVGPRGVVLIPGGRAHTIRNESAEEALAYVVYAPGAPIEGFARAAGELAAAGTPGMAEVVALAERHGIEITGPVPVPA
jgi:oxalate decarboxylase/phosphoglucose isomerase-like protein (cupin superfamily)